MLDDDGADAVGNGRAERSREAPVAHLRGTALSLHSLQLSFILSLLEGCYCGKTKPFNKIQPVSSES